MRRHRCYPLVVFEQAAEDNGWRLKEDRGEYRSVWIKVVPQVGRLVITRHSNGRLQVQGVPVNSKENRKAQAIIHEQLWDGRRDVIAGIVKERDIPFTEAEAIFEERWQDSKEPSQQLRIDSTNG